MRGLSLRRYVTPVMSALVTLAGIAQPGGLEQRPSANERVVFAAKRTGAWEIYSVRRDGRGPAQLTFMSAMPCGPFDCGSRDPQPSPDGRLVAFEVRNEGIRVVTADGRRVVLRIRSGSEPAWAPDSKRLAYSGGGGIQTVGIGRVSGGLGAFGEYHCDPAWSPDGRALLYRRGRFGCPTLMVLQGRVARRVAEGVVSAGWAPGGRRIAFVRRATASAGPTVWIVRADGTGAREITQGSEVAWSPDGRSLAVVGPTGAGPAMPIRIASVATGRVWTLTSDRLPSDLAWSPRGDALAYVGWGPDSRNYGVHLVSLAGRVSTPFPSYPYGGPLDGVAWSRPAAATQYRAPQPVAAPSVASENELQVAGEVRELAADGDQVAYSFVRYGAPSLPSMSPANVSVWRPGGAVVPIGLQFLGGQLGFSPTYDSVRAEIYSLALADERIGYGLLAGGNTSLLRLAVADVKRPFQEILVAGAKGSGAGTGRYVGNVLGDGTPACVQHLARLLWPTAGVSVRAVRRRRSIRVARAWAPDSSRVVYVSVSGIRVVRTNGAPVEQSTTGPRDCRPAWSPDGATLLFIRGCSGPARLVVLRRGKQKPLAENVERAAWAPGSRWIAYAERARIDGASQIWVVRRDASGRHLLGTGSGFITWSPDGKRLAFSGNPGTSTIRVATIATRRVRPLATDAPPRSLAWSPHDDTIAYLGGLREAGYAVRVVTLNGRRRSVVSPSPHGGALDGLTWTRPPAGLAYAPPQPPQPQRIVSPTELEVWAPVIQLAADGERVAYSFGSDDGFWVSCNHSVWEPGAKAVIRIGLQAPGRERCAGSITPFRIYNLALAGDHVAHARVSGAITWFQGIDAATLAQPSPRGVAGAGTYNVGRPSPGPHAGNILGNGALLIFGIWRLNCGGGVPCNVVTRGRESESIWRLREPSWPGSCPGWPAEGPRGSHPGPCEEIVSVGGPLEPLAVDGGRIAVRHADGAIALLDATGRELRSFPLPHGMALAAELSGRDLVVLQQGGLRHYDTETGALLHVWPLPDVPSGGFCGAIGDLCPVAGERLRLEDMARGLVTYILDGRVHLLCLRDGADVAVADGTAAQLEETGLFYAYTGTRPYPGRIRFVPFDMLPIG